VESVVWRHRRALIKSQHAIDWGRRTLSSRPVWAIWNPVSKQPTSQPTNQTKELPSSYPIVDKSGHGKITWVKRPLLKTNSETVVIIQISDDDGLHLECGEPTGILNKLRVWVWHSPKPKGISTVMHSKFAHLIGTASAAEVGKMQYSCFFFWCLCLERSCHRLLLFPRITASCPLPREMPLHLV
jgi:hypothetical protein